MEEPKTVDQLKEETEAKRWRETVVEGQGAFFDDTKHSRTVKIRVEGDDGITYVYHVARSGS